MKLGTKLLLFFLLVGIIPFAITGGISLYKSSNALSFQAFNQLQSLRSIKKSQIENFFAEREGDMGVLVETVNTLRRNAFAKLDAIQKIKKAQLTEYFNVMRGQLRILKDDPFVREALVALNAAYEEGGSVQSAAWQSAVKRYDARLQDVMKDNGWYDIFLIHLNGDIVYTATRESDLGMSIPGSELSRQGMGKAYAAGRNLSAEDVYFTDFAPYAPSGGEPAGFMLAQMRDETDNVRGYVAFQIPLNKINDIMLRRDGMGKTGESYLIGPDGLMRSDSFLDPQGHSVQAAFKNSTKVDTEATQSALGGQAGQKVISDYNGNPVLSAWDPIEVGNGITWAMLSEVDVAEAFSPVDADGVEYFARYKELYGYYDLFLINPDGYCFYTVTKEGDFQTNFIKGKFADSNLGKLVKQVTDSRKFGLADFAPYAPSNNEPCAFIAQPVVNNGQVDIIVALQLSLEAINGIMQQRDGMGKTGETYLVGSDKLMRSDSFLDAEYHSVKASFANPQKGKVDTEATRAALTGVTDAKIIMDYNGNPVLSSYTPLTVGPTTWALIAEIDKSEAFAAVNSMWWMIGLLALIGIPTIVGLALWITRSITQPINRVIAGLTEGADQVASASGQVSSSSQSLAEGASEQAASLEETSSSLEEMSSMTKQNAGNSKQADSLMKDANKVVAKANSSMQQLTQSMKEINNASEETSKIIKTIDEIAFQTNLLALNAAVEAARAGEAGAGFAVVANEVRNLALRAAEAARNTSGLIEGTVKKVREGADLVSVTNEAFTEVAASAGKVGELVGEISIASNEQAQGIEQVNKAIAEMDKVTQQNAANAEESASASEEMNAQAEQMKSFVAELAALVGNSNGNGHKSHARDYQKNRGAQHKAHHTIGLPKPIGRSNVKLDPTKVIPLDEDFADF